jgi:hypothetical protein
MAQCSDDRLKDVPTSLLWAQSIAAARSQQHVSVLPTKILLAAPLVCLSHQHEFPTSFQVVMIKPKGWVVRASRSVKLMLKKSAHQLALIPADQER